MSKSDEYCLICTGDFEDINEAKHALQDPFIEDYVEETGRFTFQDLENIRVTNRISLSDLVIDELDDGTYRVSCPDAQVILNQPKAEKLAEALRSQAMFDSITVQKL